MDADLGHLQLLLSTPSAAEAVVRAEVEMRAQGFADSLRGVSGPSARGFRIEREAALIPLRGPLIPHGPVGLSAYGVTSYEAVRSELRRAAADDDIATIVLMVDSPGGHVTGIDATSDAILAARTRKPVIAVVEGLCCSAAYWLASQCDTIIVAPFSEVGSIGVLTMHIDVSRNLDASGIKVTLIHAGARKVDGNPYEVLPEEVRQEKQDDLDRMRIAFADAVVAGRRTPMLDRAAVLATEARSYSAADAVRMGLADRIGTLDAVLERLPRLTAGFVPFVRSAGAGSMLHLPAGAVLSTADAPLATPMTPPIGRVAPPVQPPTPVSPATRVDPAGERMSQRERIGRVMAHPFSAHEAGKGLAAHLAYDTDESAESIIAALDAAAKIAADSHHRRAPTLDQEMAADPQPILGSDGGSLADMTAAQRAAITAARLQGRDPIAAARKAGGLPDLPPSATGAERLPPYIGPESAALLKTLGMVP